MLDLRNATREAHDAKGHGGLSMFGLDVTWVI